MATNTALNAQSTDAITQAGASNPGNSPAVSMANMYQTLAHSQSVLFANGVNQQQQQNLVAQTAANQGTMQVYSLNTMTAAGATQKMSQTGSADNMTGLLTVLKGYEHNTDNMTGQSDSLNSNEQPNSKSTLVDHYDPFNLYK